MTVSAPPSPTETVWTDRGHDETSLHARPAPVLDLHAWHLTSFSQLAHGRHDERERRDVVVEPEDAGAIGAVADAMDAAVPLATFARGTHAGNCLHELLEQCRPRPPCFAAAHSAAPTRDSPVLSSTRWRPSPGGTGDRRRRFKC